LDFLIEFLSVSGDAIVLANSRAIGIRRALDNFRLVNFSNFGHYYYYYYYYYYY
jgi:hypothetical protein